MKEGHKKKFLFGLILFAVICVSIFTWKKYCRSKAEIYRTYLSPGGEFKIVVFRIPMSMAFPGQSGDAPGYVQLQDGSGKVLKEKKVEMVQIIEPPVWSKTGVEIKLFADWNLPK
jgi:hypothetical protein